MKNELSIETIKKEIIDNISNNMEVLKYLEIEKHDGIKLDNICNNLIFPYDIPNCEGDYISIEVAEYERSQTSIRDSKKYVVSIKIGLDNKNNLDVMASLVKGVILKVFPYIRKIDNEPFYVRSQDCFGNDRIVLNRLITFEIK